MHPKLSSPLLCSVPPTFPTPCNLTDGSPPGSSVCGIFFRQEYWSKLPFPSPGDLPNPGIEPASPVSPALAGGFFTTTPPGKPCSLLLCTNWNLGQHCCSLLLSPWMSFLFQIFQNDYSRFWGFHIWGFTQAQSKNIQRKNSKNFLKAKLGFATSWQLFTWHLHCFRYTGTLTMI